MIETHAHIYSDQFKDDLQEVIDRAKEVGVSKILMPNIDHESIDSMMEVENRYQDYCIAMMGLHPCSVNKSVDKELYIVEDWLAKRDFIAIGEIGIDLYWDKTFFEQQKMALEQQIVWAKSYNKPIVIHSRDSTNEVLEIIEKHQDGTLKGVFHCFGGTIDEADRIVKSGLLIGLGGVSTFKKTILKETIPELSLEKIVLETDCPYLAPVPHRGKRNEPSYIHHVAEVISDYQAISYDKVVEQTSINAKTLFNL